MINKILADSLDPLIWERLSLIQKETQMDMSVLLTEIVRYYLEKENLVNINEEWRDIPGFEGRYQVSNIGRIRRLNYTTISKSGISYEYKYRIAKLDVSKQRYARVKLINSDGIKKLYQIHRLVALAFIPNITNKPYINHINGNRLDNRVENLEWCTPKENTWNGIERGTITIFNKENRVQNNKLTKEQVLEIKKILAENKLSYSKIGKLYNVSISAIYNIKHNITWKNLK